MWLYFSQYELSRSSQRLYMQKKANQIQEFCSQLSSLQILPKMSFGLVSFEHSLHLKH